ncbi:MAG: hypothetical protein ACOYN0_18770 [Phycisphaerales bacterium]
MRHLLTALAAVTLVGCGTPTATEPPSGAPTSTNTTTTTEPSSGAPTSTNTTTTTDISTTPPTGVDPVVAAGATYYAALQSGNLAQVQAASSARCAPMVTESFVMVAAGKLAGFPATITVLSVGVDTASVNIDSEAVLGNDGQGTQFRNEGGAWLWDGCP